MQGDLMATAARQQRDFSPHLNKHLHHLRQVGIVGAQDTAVGQGSGAIRYSFKWREMQWESSHGYYCPQTPHRGSAACTKRTSCSCATLASTSSAYEPRKGRGNSMRREPTFTPKKTGQQVIQSCLCSTNACLEWQCVEIEGSQVAVHCLRRMLQHLQGQVQYQDAGEEEIALQWELITACG